MPAAAGVERVEIALRSHLARNCGALCVGYGVLFVRVSAYAQYYGGKAVGPSIPIMVQNVSCSSTDLINSQRPRYAFCNVNFVLVCK